MQQEKATEKNTEKTSTAPTVIPTSAEKTDFESSQDKINLQALPIRAYLDQTVVPLLLDGM